MSNYTPEEIDQLEADLRWWQVLETYIPKWKVYGWTYKWSAVIDTGEGNTISVKGRERDQIVEALYRAEGRIK